MKPRRSRPIDPERINLEPIPLTEAGIQALKDKLARLKKNLPRLAEETARTAAFGDRSDNAEYKQAKGALRYTTRQVYLIEDQLKRVVPITPDRKKKNVVQLGSVVTIQEVGGDGEKVGAAKVGAEKTYEILGPAETDPGAGRISNASPLGKALMGRSKGDVITIETNNGKKEYEVIKISISSRS